jgi:phenylacetyl-CoA:acceptor oxidoreductase subunit 2
MIMIPAAVLGLLFLFSQAMILREARGIPAWRTPRIVPLILATGLAEGAGLFVAAAALLPSLGSLAEMTAVSAVMLAAVRGWAWRSYLIGLNAEGAPTRTLRALDAFRQWFLALGVVIPLALVITGFVVAGAAAAVLALAGLCIAASGGALKYLLVTGAGYNQGFALARTPVRGCGAPGPAVKLGWS